MTPEQIVTVIVEWFDRVHGASLKLPNGWFGRPYDNLHRLTRATFSAGTVIVVLDECQELSISSPGSVSVDPKELRLVNSTRIVWRWVEYGSTEVHVDVFEGGDVEFAIP
jgi:hypothetical protein